MGILCTHACVGSHMNLHIHITHLHHTMISQEQQHADAVAKHLASKTHASYMSMKESSAQAAQSIAADDSKPYLLCICITSLCCTPPQCVMM